MWGLFSFSHCNSFTFSSGRMKMILKNKPQYDRNHLQITLKCYSSSTSLWLSVSIWLVIDFTEICLLGASCANSKAHCMVVFLVFHHDFLLNHYIVGAEETTTNTIQQSQKSLVSAKGYKKFGESMILVRRRDRAVRGREQSSGWSTVGMKNSSLGCSTLRSYRLRMVYHYLKNTRGVGQ